MDRDPYRGEKQLDAKLEKLAAAGRERIAEAASEESAAASKQESAGDRNVRAALGGYYGTPLRTFLTALLVTCIVTALTGIVLGIAHASLPRDAPLAILAAHAERIGALFGLSVLATPIALVARLIVTPLASPARVAAERAWARSLPIGLDDGYIDVLALDPVLERRLEIRITFKDGLPPRDIVESVVGVADPKARVVSRHGNAVTLVSGSLSGDVGVSVGMNGGSATAVLRNHRIVAYVHDFVAKVLLPVHESAPIAEVTFRAAKQSL